MKDRSSIDDGATARDSARKPGVVRSWVAGGMLGIALGAMLLGGTAVAQSDTDGGLGQSFIDRLAEKLGMTPDELETTIKETQDEAIDDAVADGRLTEEQGTALKERVDSGSGIFRMMPERHAFGMHAFRQLDINLATIASELGMTTDELRDELAAGSTLSEVISAHGSTVEVIVTALVAEAESELDEAVANGNLTQEQADEMLANLPERLTQMIESGLPGGCERRFNGDSDTTDDAGETSSQVCSTMPTRFL
jgi:polyhydroxyalkanoate synthesis regulator phasin